MARTRKTKVKPDPNAMRRGPEEQPRNAGCGGGLCSHPEGAHESGKTGEKGQAAERKS